MYTYTKQEEQEDEIDTKKKKDEQRVKGWGEEGRIVEQRVKKDKHKQKEE